MTNTQITINITERTDKLNAVRAAGNTPAVFYGPKEEATSIQLNTREFEQLWKTAGESTIVILKGVGEDKEVLINSVQWHPTLDHPVHVDFYAIERGKKLTVSIPLEFIGEAPAEKLGGNVNKVMQDLEIEVRPSDIPQNIEVDVTKLEDLSSTITVADLTLPESATPTGGTEEVVASISVQVEEDLSAPVGDAMAPEETEGDDAEAGADTAEGDDTEKKAE